MIDIIENKKSDVKRAFCKHCGELASIQIRKIGGKEYWINVFDKHKRNCMTLRVQRRLGFSGD